MMKGHLICALLLCLCFCAGAQTSGVARKAAKPPSRLKFGVSAGGGLSMMLDDADPDDRWNPSFSHGAEIFARWDYASLFALQAELGYARVSATRNYPHPQAYVFNKKVTLESKRLQIPVSFILILGNKPNGQQFCIGAGAYVAKNLELNLSNELIYAHSSVNETVSILNESPGAIYGFHGSIQLREWHYIMGLSFFHDLTSYRIESLDTGDMQHWGMRLNIGFTGK